MLVLCWAGADGFFLDSIAPARVRGEGDQNLQDCYFHLIALTLSLGIKSSGDGCAVAWVAVVGWHIFQWT